MASKKEKPNPDAMPTPGSLGALPTRLSPSRAKDFMQCPKLFYYKTILKIPTPGTEATYKGTLAHYAFELIFDHPRGERDPDTAVSYVRPAWVALTNPLVDRAEVEEGTPEARVRENMGAYRDLHLPGSRGEEKLLKDAKEALEVIKDPERLIGDAEEVVRSWFKMENPNKFDPLGREYHIEAEVDGVTLHGFIDRLDKITGKDGSVRYYISDYKTGKPPKPRYEEEAFFQLDVYAALLEAKLGVIPYQLRLIYVREGHPDAVLTRRVTPERLKRVKGQTKAVWKAIQDAARKETWVPRKQILCDWCFFKPVCPAWEPELDGLLPEEIRLRTGLSDA